MRNVCSSGRIVLIVSAVVALVAAIAAAVTRDRWLPPLTAAIGAENEPVDPHAGHDHASHAAAKSIKLSANGLKNIGYEALVVEPTTYEKSLTLPAIVVERPGRSQLHIAAPLTGEITAIHAVPGEGIHPDEPLFDMRLTHEELVAAQRDYLKTVTNLEITNREIERLESLGEGVIAGKRVLEQQYEKQKLELSLLADEQAMLLHGMSEEQIGKVRNERQLFRRLTVRAPAHTDTDEACKGPHLFTVQRLGVAQGEQVESGHELAVLADHCELHVEVLAFEDDAPAIRQAAEANRRVTARLLQGDSAGAVIRDLEILYVADQIDRESRALKAYLRLANEVALDKETPGGKRFLEWRYKPGQRMQVSVPVETWENQIVLPNTAVVVESAEAYVYRQNSDSFEQVAVHVLHRDQNAVVIANNGALFPGDVIAGAGAYQMHLALKNQAGGGIDPHAGHNH